MPGAEGAALTTTWCANSSVVSPKAWPALNAATFASRISGLDPNFCSSQVIVGSVGRPYIQDTSPRANMFLARSASFFEIPRSSTARTVIEVIGTFTTV